MSFPPLYKDLGKNANDLLNKGFPSSDNFSWKFELDTVSPNGVQFTPFIQSSFNGSLGGELKAKFPCCDYTVTTAANLREEVSVEISSNKNYSGFRPTLTFLSSPSNLLEKLKVKPALEFRSEFGNFTANADVPVSRASPYPVGDDPLRPAKDAPKVVASGVLGYKACGFAAGAEVDVAPLGRQLNSLNLTINYVSPSLEAAIFSKSKFGSSTSTTVGGNYYKKLASGWQDAAVGGEIQYDAVSAKSSPPVLALGGLFRPDILSVVKARINTKGLFGFAFTQKWGGPFSFVLSGDLNILQLQGPNAAQFGVKISIK